jgi:hypothetical protein
MSTALPHSRVELVDPIEDGRWSAFVAGQAGATVHHHRAWLELLRSAYDCPITACCLVDRSGTVVAGAPLALVPDGRGRRRLTCVPFAAVCGPLPRPQDDPILARELVPEIDALRRRLGVPAELRGPTAVHPGAYVARRLRPHRVPLPAPVGAAPDGLVVERRTDARGLAELQRLLIAGVAGRRRGGGSCSASPTSSTAGSASCCSSTTAARRSPARC